MSEDHQLWARETPGVWVAGLRGTKDALESYLSRHFPNGADGHRLIAKIDE
jgi:hypothetical protein